MSEVTHRHKVKVLALDLSTDVDEYSTICSDPKNSIHENQTYFSTKGESFVVLKYSYEENNEASKEVKINVPMIGF